MNSASQLYSNLFQLTQENEAFYFMDYGPYRVFNYRLASYTDFLAPDALEARGIMFYMKEDKDPKLVCRPFKKFFNKDENPFTMDLDFSPENVAKVAVKEDGSIITSYYCEVDRKMKVKSKQSLFSAQTLMANEFLARPENELLRDDTAFQTRLGRTVIFELVSPANRIVLEYKKTELRVLGVRDNRTGELYEQDQIVDDACPTLASNWVSERFSNSETSIDPNKIASQEGIEGFVYTLKDGTMVKVKTDWYKTLHHLKDSVQAPRHLYEAIIYERIDDVKAMFATDQFTMDRIKAMEDLVIPKFNHMVKTVEDFCSANRDLDRKNFAIKGQQELKGFFSLAMNRYLGKEVDYKEFAKKYREEHFGVKILNEEGIEE